MRLAWMSVRDRVRGSLEEYAVLILGNILSCYLVCYGQKGVNEVYSIETFALGTGSTAIYMSPSTILMLL